MKKTIFQNLTLALLIAVASSMAISLGSEGVPPIADAGSSRYAVQDPVFLDGNGSYDPDNSGPLSYTWHQISGPTVVISDADTATPTISGFIKMDEIQECEFELIVSDGELTSLPDTVKVIIVPDFGLARLFLENPPFEPEKPTIIYFGGGDCVTGYGRWDSWYDLANVISSGYGPDTVEYELWRTYYQYGDMVIVYLSSVAPDYKQPIQTIGWSTGGMPAIDVGIRLNRVYADVRYAVNRVTHLDANPACRLVERWPSQQPLQPWDVYWDVYLDTVELFLTSSVDGEQCWIDHYYGTTGYQAEPIPRSDILLVRTGLGHGPVRNWYRNSLTGNDMNNFNSGVVGGAYWSVIGPGKNLQLAPHTNAYYFRWDGNELSGGMSFFLQSEYTGRLPEPVNLLEQVDVGDPNGAVLTCKESENAVGYQLLFGPDPYRVMDYNIISDTPAPPNEVIITLPFEETWWTVRAYDQFGSTIYADPICTNAFRLSLPVENLTKDKRYSYIQFAIDDAMDNDEIVLSKGIYRENIDFKSKDLTVRSTNPNDPAVVAATVINGVGQRPVVTLSRGQGAGCVLAGLTITGGTVGISCGDASPTIRNCTIGSNGPNAIEFWEGYEPPTTIDCTIIGKVAEVERYDPTLVAYWKLDEVEGYIAYNSNSDNHGILSGNPTWKPDSGQVAGALEFDGIDDYITTDFVLNPMLGSFSAFAWIKGGSPGQVVISQIGIGGEGLALS